MMYYHTQHNRRVRKVDLTKVDFVTPTALVRQLLDKVKSQDVEDLTPQK